MISVIDKTDYLGYLRTRYWFGPILALAVVGLHAFAGLLMANDLKLGYKFAVTAAFSPFVLRYWAFSDFANVVGGEISLFRKISGGSTISLILRSHCALWCCILKVVRTNGSGIASQFEYRPIRSHAVRSAKL